MTRETDRLRRQIEDLKTELLSLQQKLEAWHPKGVVAHEPDMHLDSETALRQSEEKFRLAFQTSPDTIILGN